MCRSFFMHHTLFFALGRTIAILVFLDRLSVGFMWDIAIGALFVHNTIHDVLFISEHKQFVWAEIVNPMEFEEKAHHTHLNANSIQPKSNNRVYYFDVFFPAVLFCLCLFRGTKLFTAEMRAFYAWKCCYLNSTSHVRCIAVRIWHTLTVINM